MKNIDLFRKMLDYCNQLTDMKDELNDIEIPFAYRDLSKTKVHQLLSCKSAEKCLQYKIKTLLINLSEITKCIDKEYLKHLTNTHQTVRIPLDFIIKYDSNEGISSDCFVFEECVPSLKNFLLSEIYKYEYLDKKQNNLGTV